MVSDDQLNRSFIQLNFRIYSLTTSDLTQNFDAALLTLYGYEARHQNNRQSDS